MPLNQLFFFSDAGVNADECIHVIVQALCAGCHTQTRPWCTQGTPRVPAGCSVRCTSDKAVTPGNQVCNENGDSRHLTCDSHTLLCPHPDSSTRIKVFAFILTNQNVLLQWCCYEKLKYMS